jgi:hypothetical protein
VESAFGKSIVNRKRFPLRDFDHATLLPHCGKEESIAHSFFNSSGIYQIT